MKIVEILIDGGSLLKKVENAEAEKLVKANAAKYASKARWKAEVRDFGKPAKAEVRKIAKQVATAVDVLQDIMEAKP